MIIMGKWAINQCYKSLKAAIILMMLVASIILNIKIFPSQATTGRAIKLTSSKPLYQPQELVTLTALVTYNDAPIANKDVAFQVEGPRNPIYNFTIPGSNRTNDSGIATFSFRLPWPDIKPELQVLGTWSAVATVDIAGQVVKDTTSFQVLWIIELVKIETLNVRLEPQSAFLRTETVLFNLTVINHASVKQTATIAVHVQDAASQPIMSIMLTNRTIQPGQNIIQASAQIPVYARIGLAKAVAVAFTAPPETGGVPYCPPISTTFQIITRDISIVQVTPSKNVIDAREKIQITVLVKNKGNETESPFITVYYDGNAIETKQAPSIPPSAEMETIFEWDTSNVPSGSYLISATAQPVEGEIETADNTFIDGIVTILPVITPFMRDVAVTSVQAQPTQVNVGEKVQVTVYVKNLGSSPESFNVIAYYDNYPIAAQYVSMLPPNTQKELTFLWNTVGVGTGTYTIKAYIPPLLNETNIENNLYVDGNVTILPISPPIIHDVAVRYVQAAPNIVFAGEVVQIRVDVENLGTTTENFTVITYYDDVEIATRNVDLLLPKSTATLYFYWNTSGVGPGTYTIKAYIPPLPNEINTENNLYVNGNVTIKAPVKIHDVAILYVNVSKKLAYIGDTIQILVSAANLGDFPETFNVSVYYNESRMYIQKVSLNPKQTINITFNWDTSGLAAGSYIIWASAEIVPEEVNIENNCFVNGMVTLLSKPPPLIRDIAIVNLTANPSSVIVGENVTIKAVVADLGDFPETFNLTIFCEKKLIAEFTVNLQPHTEEAMTYIWNTSNVTPGVYKIWGNVTILENEINTENNFFENGKVTIKAPLPIQMLLEFLIPLAIVACLTLLALILFYIVARRRRRRRKRPKRSYALILHKGI